MNTNTTQIVTLVFVAAMIMSGAARAGEINTGYFGNTAIKGFDPVAYFTERRALRGSEKFSHDWLGAKWLFANATHRDLFVEDPVKYAPQYGGHCADGVAYGDLTRNIDPRAWRIIEGKLYLNYDQGAAAEIEELEGQLERSRQNWPRIRARLLENATAN